MRRPVSEAIDGELAQPAARPPRLDAIPQRQLRRLIEADDQALPQPADAVARAQARTIDPLLVALAPSPQPVLHKQRAQLRPPRWIFDVTQRGGELAQVTVHVDRRERRRVAGAAHDFVL